LGIRKKIEDVQDMKEVYWFIMMPTSVCKGVWNLVVVIILAYTATYMPYKTCFVDDDDTLGILIDWTVDLLFITDIFVNFISAFDLQDGSVETRLKEIAKDYAGSWFMFDLISCLPFNLLETVVAPPVEEGDGSNA
jgi:hypothetical protein